MNVPELIDVGTLDRSTYMGGGDIAALLGLSPWATPLDVFVRKREGEPAEADDAQLKRWRRGKLLEPVVVEMLRQDYGIEVVAQNHRYRDPEYPFLAAEIDFEWFDGEDPRLRNGEIKTVHPFAANQWGEAGTEEVPAYNAAQSMWGLMITGRELCQYGVLFGGQDSPTLYHIRRDSETIATMRQVAVDFWYSHVLPGVPPPPRTLGDLKKLYPLPIRDSVECDAEIAAKLSRHKELHALMNLAKKECEELEFGIKEFVRDHAVIVRNGLPLATYRAQSRAFVDEKKLRALYPEIHAQLCKTSTFRVLRHKG